MALLIDCRRAVFTAAIRVMQAHQLSVAVLNHGEIERLFAAFELEQLQRRLFLFAAVHARPETQ